MPKPSQKLFPLLGKKSIKQRPWLDGQKQDVTLIAVSKQQQAERIDASLAMDIAFLVKTVSKKQKPAGRSGKSFTQIYVYI